MNLDMTDSMGPGKLVRHMQNPSYTYDEYLICIGLGPSISSVICNNPSYSGPSYPSSPVYASQHFLKIRVLLDYQDFPILKGLTPAQLGKNPHLPYLRIVWNWSIFLGSIISQSVRAMID